MCCWWLAAAATAAARLLLVFPAKRLFAVWAGPTELLLVGPPCTALFPGAMFLLLLLLLLLAPLLLALGGGPPLVPTAFAPAALTFVCRRTCFARWSDLEKA